ncbi:hypothetical protein V1525DRAFT_459829 [Lipomyces kononenkoae]|uniref:Uncharacterized protein n=1 Tax=Lipomyces kononenkoae TaxID=34357 RepID=A0ACC3SS54_LIPKO
MQQPSIFGMTDGESVDTERSINSHLTHAEHHASQAKLRQASAQIRLTGYTEDASAKAIEAEKDYFLAKPSSEREQYLELFESIQNITDVEAQWDALRRRFHGGDEINLADMREFVDK